MKVLGISCHFHDAGACLIEDGRIVAAAAEERFSRKKHDGSFPERAIRYCLEEGGIRGQDLHAVAMYEKPIQHFHRILASSVATFPWSLGSWLRAIPPWLNRKLWIKKLIRKELDFTGPVYFSEHHMAHAASAFFLSPFDRAAILTMDGVGEWASATISTGSGNRIEMLGQMNYPHSLGFLYSAFTYYLGFKVNSAEYKVMGLAPYGKPIYKDKIYQMIDLKDDGTFRLDMSYFAYHYGLHMTSRKFHDLFGEPPYERERNPTQREFNLAASVQEVTEEIILKLVRNLHERTGEKNLCLAGGVALNCVANGRLLRESPFEDIWVQPASGDDGGAIGAAIWLYNQVFEQARDVTMDDCYLGPSFSQDEIDRYLESCGVPHHRMGRDDLLKTTARCIDQQDVIGWFQGRMEYGPRALGSRSILADARNPENKDVVNLKIKQRESFRPFAPTVLADKCSEYFDIDRETPYMLLVAQVREDHRVIPSVTHVNGSARIQTINRVQNELYYDLIKEFENQTGVPVIINTSFNVRGEPIVCTPHDAFLCFMRTDMDVLVLGSSILYKRECQDLTFEDRRIDLD